MLNLTTRLVAAKGKKEPHFPMTVQYNHFIGRPEEKVTYEYEEAPR